MRGDVHIWDRLPLLFDAKVKTRVFPETCLALSDITEPAVNGKPIGCVPLSTLFTPSITSIQFRELS